jgi:hypothetical protein
MPQDNGLLTRDATIGRNDRVWKAVARGASVLFVLSFAFSGSFYYWPSLPHSPRPELGFIYPLNNHGWITYMTAAQWWLCNLSFVFSVLCLIVVFWINRRVLTRRP